MELVPLKTFGEPRLLRTERGKISARLIGKRSLKRDFIEGWFPLVVMIETKDSVVVKAGVPGIEAKDVNCSISRDVLTIKGERKTNKKEDNKHGHCIERGSGFFQRLIKMPSNVKADQTEATINKGVLSVALPKADEFWKKKISVKVNNTHEALLPGSIIKTNVI